MSKKKEFWTIRTNDQGRYAVVPITFVEKSEDGLKYYRVPFLFEGRHDTLVTNVKDERVFETEDLALIECEKQCRIAAQSWLDAADQASNKRSSRAKFSQARIENFHGVIQIVISVSGGSELELQQRCEMIDGSPVMLAALEALQVRLQRDQGGNANSRWTAPLAVIRNAIKKST